MKRFKVGDRVLIEIPFALEFHGKTATITKISDSGDCNLINFEGPAPYIEQNGKDNVICNIKNLKRTNSIIIKERLGIV